MTRTRNPDLAAASRAIHDFLAAVGAPMDDPELQQTGQLVATAFAEELLQGYDQQPAEILKGHTASSSPGPVVLRNIATTTVCPHHLMPASGVVHVGYVPGERIVGFGALGRLVDCFARRLTLQEDISHNVAAALVEHLQAKAAICVADLVPSCVTARGARRHNARAITVGSAGDQSRTGELRALALNGSDEAQS